jgi:hypothetical protein
MNNTAEGETKAKAVISLVFHSIKMEEEESVVLKKIVKRTSIDRHNFRDER